MKNIQPTPYPCMINTICINQDIVNVFLKNLVGYALWVCWSGGAKSVICMDGRCVGWVEGRGVYGLESWSYETFTKYSLGFGWDELRPLEPFSLQTFFQVGILW